MFIFNATVPCFPLDCSQIVVSVLGMRGWPPVQVATFIVRSRSVGVSMHYSTPTAAPGTPDSTHDTSHTRYLYTQRFNTMTFMTLTRMGHGTHKHTHTHMTHPHAHSAVVLFVLVVHGLARLSSGDPLASLSLFMAAWLALQTYKLYELVKAGEVERCALFAGSPARSSAHEGRPAPPNAQVSAGLVLAVAIALTAVPL